jgi:hypothetical protein
MAGTMSAIRPALHHPKAKKTSNKCSKKIAHVCFGSSDLAKTRKFYCEFRYDATEEK